jgi:hypothetical protein
MSAHDRRNKETKMGKKTIEVSGFHGEPSTINELVVEGILQNKSDKEIAKTLSSETQSISQSNVRRIKERDSLKHRLHERRKQLLAMHRFHTEEVTGSLVQIVRSSIEDVIEIQEGGDFRIDMEVAKETGALNCIKSVSYDAHGNPRVEMYDRLKATDQLADIFGMKAQPRKNEDAVADIAALDLMRTAEENGAPMNYDEARKILREVKETHSDNN